MMWCLVGLAKLTALFNDKARAFVNGRKDLFPRMIAAFRDQQEKVIWFHCASLGEFEQGRPVIERLKSSLPDHKILLTFFSPSGYEVRKNYLEADYIFYLPYDLPWHAQQFISIAKPALAIFIKYEFWPNIYFELEKRHIPIISVSSIFRGDHIFFKTYGGFMRKVLRAVHYFFVQDQKSVGLLKSIGLINISVSGDTRFDRVFQITLDQQEIMVAKKFKGTQACWVAGSCWPEDMAILAPFINSYKGKLKFIIAPHEISETFVSGIVKSLEVKSVRYSQANLDLEDTSVLIIDNIGLLSKLYGYGEYAYVGGAYGKGLHNILEAACYGIPVFFGNKNYRKYGEAVDLIDQGGAYAVAGVDDLKSFYENLASSPENYSKACIASKDYVKTNLGATEKIVAYIKNILNQK